MSALVERIIAARDRLTHLARSDMGYGEDVKYARDAMADAANAISERDETIHALRSKFAKFEAFSSVELQNCARYVEAAANAIEGTDRGRELARLVLRVGQ